MSDVPLKAEAGLSVPRRASPAQRQAEREKDGETEGKTEEREREIARAREKEEERMAHRLCEDPHYIRVHDRFFLPETPSIEYPPSSGVGDVWEHKMRRACLGFRV